MGADASSPSTASASSCCWSTSREPSAWHHAATLPYSPAPTK